jgi:hypothetical protein
VWNIDGHERLKEPANNNAIVEPEEYRAHRTIATKIQDLIGEFVC